MNRRDFLKLTGAATLVFASGGVPWFFRKLSPSPKLRGSGKIVTRCTRCSLLCAMELRHRNGRVLAAKGRDSDAISGGRLCPRALAFAGRKLDTAATFHFRAAGTTVWQELSREDAVSRAAQIIIATRNRSFVSAEGGFIVNRLPGALALAGSALTNEEAFAFTRLARALGMPYAGTDHLLLRGDALEGMRGVFGVAASHLPPESLEHSSVIIICGADPLRVNPPLVRHLQAARRNGAFIVALDPIRTATAAFADLHLRLTPGSDAALFSGVANFLLQHDAVRASALKQLDAPNLIPSFFGFDGSRFTGASGGMYDYVIDERGEPARDGAMRSHDTVYRRYIDFVAPFTPTVVAGICGIREEEFLALAEKVSLCASGGTLGSVIGGAAANGSRGACIRSLGAVHLLTGTVGVPGGGIIWLKEGRNAQGIDDMMPSWHELPGGIPLPDVAAARPESDYKTYLRNHTAADESSYLAGFAGRASSALQALFHVDAAAGSREGFDLLPKINGRRPEPVESAGTPYQLALLPGCSLRQTFGPAGRSRVLGGGFVFASHDTEDQRAWFDEAGPSAADVLVMKSAPLELRAGSLTDTFRNIIRMEGVPGAQSELAFLFALARAFVADGERSDTVHPDPLRLMRTSSDAAELFAVISGGSDGPESIPDGAASCGNWMYAGAAGRVTRRRSFCWPGNVRYLFNRLRASDPPQQPKAQKLFAEDVPHAAGKGEGAFPFLPHSYARLFNGLSVHGPFPVFYHHPVLGRKDYPDPAGARPEGHPALIVETALAVLHEWPHARDLYPEPLCETGAARAAVLGIADGALVELTMGGVRSRCRFRINERAGDLLRVVSPAFRPGIAGVLIRSV